jgi:hypothetical protein
MIKEIDVSTNLSIRNNDGATFIIGALDEDLPTFTIN